MKRWLRRFIYLVVVAGTAGFAFYQHKQSQKEAKEEEKKGLILPSLEPLQVQSVFIKKADMKIHFFRQNGGWQMDSPIQDLADRDLVGVWLKNLLSEKVTVIKEAGVDWSEYGLDQNTKNIEIKTTSDETLQLEISHYSAYDGSFYLRKGEHLLLGKSSWARLTDKKKDDFRSYKLLNMVEHPKVFRYHSGSFKARLKWDNYTWAEEEKGDVMFPLSQSDLESYWNSLTNVEFEKEVYPNTKEFRRKFRLLKPAIEIQLEFKNEKNWSAKISPEVNGKFYALVSTRDYIFTLNKEKRKSILLTEKAIRDHRQPFQFKQDQLYFMDLKGYGLDIQLKKEKDQWVLLRGMVNRKEGETPENKKTEKSEESGEALASALSHEQKSNGVKTEGKPADEQNQKGEDHKRLDTAELRNVLNRINTLSAQKYFGNKKSFVKTSHLILKDKDEKVILQLELSDSFELEDKKMVYVSSSIGQEVMSLDFDDVQLVFSPSLLK